MQTLAENQSINSNLLTEQELMHWLDCKKRATLEKYLRQQGIPVLYGKGGKICTTLQAINDSLTGHNSSTTVEF